VRKSHVERARMADLRALDGCWPRWSPPNEELLLVLVPCAEEPRGPARTGTTRRSDDLR
jgi:hypothetical protein